MDLIFIAIVPNKLKKQNRNNFLQAKHSSVLLRFGWNSIYNKAGRLIKIVPFQKYIKTLTFQKYYKIRWITILLRGEEAPQNLLLYRVDRVVWQVMKWVPTNPLIFQINC